MFCFAFADIFPNRKTGYEHEDAHEYFQLVLEEMEEEAAPT